MADLDKQEAESPGRFDVLLAVLGLAAAVALGYMAVDVLRTMRAKQAAADGTLNGSPCADC
jgi:hypothetical protein